MGIPTTAVVSRVGLVLAAQMAVLVAQRPPDPNQNIGQECTVSYTHAYMSALNGACIRSQAGCSPSCQQDIDVAVDKCANQKFNETDPITGIVAERSFLQKAVRAIQAIGPVDCDYRAGYENCEHDLCSLANITGGVETSTWEKHDCITKDPFTSQSHPSPAWHSCEGVCRTEFEELVRMCSSCEDPRVHSFMAEAGSKLVKCTTGNAHSCSRLRDSLNSACCAGADNIVGSGDDVCDITRDDMPDSCMRNSVCAGALQGAGAECAHQFTTSSKLLGLFLDCGGTLNQLFAAEPIDTLAPAYCTDADASGSFPMPGRRLVDVPEAELRSESLPTYSWGRATEKLFAKVLERNEWWYTRRALQAAVPADPNIDPMCQASQHDAFTSAVNGDCSQPTCTSSCQKIISKMIHDCKGQSITVHDAAANMTYREAYLAKAVSALQEIAPPDCAYHAGYRACAENCNVANASRVLNGLLPAEHTMDPECAVFFMGSVIHEWKGCGTPSTGGGWNYAPKSLKDKCWARYIQYVESCSGCVDPFIQNFLYKTSLLNANTHCEDCDQPQGIANKIRQVCCAGSDGTLGSEDDPCTQHVERNIRPGAGGAASRTHDVTWYVPDTCDAGSACQAYVLEIASNGCPSLFINDGNSGGQSGGVGLGMFVDCGGDAAALLSRGADCSAPVVPANGSLGSCNATTIKSGRMCEMTCETGYCVSGQQPHCFDGQLVNTMTCKPAPVQSCDNPPNGGCDRHTTCDDTTRLFGTKLVKCSACPNGYFGSGRSGCRDIDECKLIDNGGCDVHTSCRNLDGGYFCSACPQGMFGKQYDIGGCKHCANVENAAADASISCNGPGASNISACAQGFYKVLARQGNLCVKCTQCTPGQFMRVPCTAEDNAVCIDCAGIDHALATAEITCTAADDSRFSSGGCEAGYHRYRLAGADVCQRCTLCTQGKFTKSPCSSVDDAVCEACTPVPGAGRNATYSCTNEDDSTVDKCSRGDFNQNGRCSQCSVCTDGKYEASPCSDTADRKCCTRCSTGKYVSRECGASDTECNDCTAIAHASPSAVLSCTTQSDSRISECASGFFRVPGSDAGWFNRATPDACKQCTSCSPGRYESAPCSIATDTVCKDCTRVADADADAKYTCTSDSDSQVSACAVRTSSGVTVRYYRTRTLNEADTCSPCSSCLPGTFQAAACTAETDTVCPRCSAVPNSKGLTTCKTSTDSRVQSCDMDFYLIPGNADEGDTCVACSSCQPGKYQVERCTSKRDSQCTDCTPVSHGEGLVKCTSASDSHVDVCTDSFWHQPRANKSDLCHSCTTCEPGRYQRTACGVGTPSHDTDCVVCEPGMYQPSVAASDCTRCPAGTYLDIPGGTSKQSCIGCEIGKYSEKLGSILASDCVSCATGETTGNVGAASPHVCVASSDTKTIGGFAFAVLALATCVAVACTKKRELDPKDVLDLLNQNRIESLSGSMSESGRIGDTQRMAVSLRDTSPGNE